MGEVLVDDTSVLPVIVCCPCTSVSLCKVISLGSLNRKKFSFDRKKEFKDKSVT